MSATRDTPIPVEIEAKLTVPEADLRTIARLTQLGPYPLRGRATARLHSTYLDTPALTLARNGVALRLRRHGRHWEATMKWAGHVEDAVHERPELTVPLPRPPALPFRPPAGPLQLRLAALTAGRSLLPILISEIRRQLFDVLPLESPLRDLEPRPPSAAAAMAEDAPTTAARRDATQSATHEPMAELALDRVCLRAPAGNEAAATYCEIEIERRHGSRRDVVRLARLLRDGFNLQPSHESKFSRGLALVYGHDILGSDDEPLLAHEPMAAALRHMVARHLLRLRRHDPATRIGADPEALHDMRVATRRLRAAVRLFKAGLSARIQSHLSHELRWLGETLGGVRDLDVQLAKLTAFTIAAPAGFRPALRRLHEHLGTDRTNRRTEMLARLDSARYWRLLIQLERFAYSSAPQRPRDTAALEPIGVAGRRAIKKAFRRLLERGEKIHEMPRPEDLHALRIRAKRLRYLLEFLEELTGKPGRRLVKQLTRLQDLLGSYHDAVVAADFVRTYVEGTGTQLAPASMVALGALVASELRLAEQKRADFEATWRRFTRNRTLDANHAVLRRLHRSRSAPATAATETPAPAGAAS